MTDKEKYNIICKIEVLETASFLIGGFGEGGELWVEEEDIGNEFDETCCKFQNILANQLNNRANNIRKKYGLEKNTFKY